jgi:hypothetical protein
VAQSSVAELFILQHHHENQWQVVQSPGSLTLKVIFTLLSFWTAGILRFIMVEIRIVDLKRHSASQMASERPEPSTTWLGLETAGCGYPWKTIISVLIILVFWSHGTTSLRGTKQLQMLCKCKSLAE